MFNEDINFIDNQWLVYKDDSFYFIFFHSLENLISVFQASFTAFEITNCHVIYLSTNYLAVN